MTGQTFNTSMLRAETRRAMEDITRRLRVQEERILGEIDEGSISDKAYADAQDAIHSAADRLYADQQDAAHSVTDQAYADGVAATAEAAAKSHADTEDAIHSAADQAYADGVAAAAEVAAKAYADTEDAAHSVVDQAYADGVSAAAEAAAKAYADAEDAAHENDVTGAHAASAVSFDGSLLSPISKIWHPDTIVDVQDSNTTIIAEIDGRIEAGDTDAIIDAINGWTGGDSTITNEDVFQAGVIVTEAIAAGAVVASKMAANSVEAASIVAGAVDGTHISAASDITVGSAGTVWEITGTALATTSKIATSDAAWGNGQGVWMDASGRFQLGGALTWDGSTLTIGGYASDTDVADVQADADAAQVAADLAAQLALDVAAPFGGYGLAALSPQVVMEADTYSWSALEGPLTILKNGVTVVDEVAQGSTGTLVLAAGDIMEPTAACGLVAANSKQPIPLVYASDFFMYYANRNFPQDLEIYAVGENVDIEVRHTDQTAVTPDWTLTVPANTVGTLTLTGQATDHIYIRGTGKFVCMAHSGGKDVMSMFPPSREVMIGKTHTAAPESDWLLTRLTATVNGTVYSWVTSDFGLISMVSIGDGAGSNADMGIPLDCMGDTYVIPHSLDGYQVFTPFPGTIKVYEWQTNAWVEVNDLDASAASRSAHFGVQVGTVGGGGTVLGAGPFKFTGTNRFGLRVNTATDDEYQAFGYVANLRTQAVSGAQSKKYSETGTEAATAVGAAAQADATTAIADAATALSAAELAVLPGEVNANVTAISGGAITTGTVDANRLSAVDVRALWLTAGKIDTIDLAANAVEAATIAAGSITAEKMAVNSVEATSIVAGSVDGTHISASSDIEIGSDANNWHIEGTAAEATTVIRTSNATTYADPDGVWIGADSRVSFKDKFLFDGTDLAIAGAVEADSFTLLNPSNDKTFEFTMENWLGVGDVPSLLMWDNNQYLNAMRLTWFYGETDGQYLRLGAINPATLADEAALVIDVASGVSEISLVADAGDASVTAGLDGVELQSNGGLFTLGASGVINTNFRLLAADGTAAAPTYSFGSSGDTGMYRRGTGEVGFSTGGTEVMRLVGNNLRMTSSSTIFNVGWFRGDSGVGTAALPTFSFGGDTNTGMYRSATDEVAITGGGIKIARFAGTNGLSIDGPNRGTDNASWSLAQLRLYTRDAVGTEATNSLVSISFWNQRYSIAPMIRSFGKDGEMLAFVSNPGTAFVPVMASAFTVSSTMRVKKHLEVMEDDRVIDLASKWLMAEFEDTTRPQTLRKTDRFKDVDKRWQARGGKPLEARAERDFESMDHSCVGEDSRCHGTADNPCPITRNDTRRHGTIAEWWGEVAPEQTLFDEHGIASGINVDQVASTALGAAGALSRRLQDALDRIDILEGKTPTPREQGAWVK